MSVHIEILVEEFSMELFLRKFLPRVLTSDTTFSIHAFRSKNDLLRQLPKRLAGYARWIPENWYIVVVVDRDDDDCHDLKLRIEDSTTLCGLIVKPHRGEGRFALAVRVAIEELEAWYFGDWQAVMDAFPNVSASVVRKAGFRDPDAIAGGTWEAFERVLKKFGYYRNGLLKIEVASFIGDLIMPSRSTSQSFLAFKDLIGNIGLHSD